MKNLHSNEELDLNILIFYTKVPDLAEIVASKTDWNGMNIFFEVSWWMINYFIIKKNPFMEQLEILNVYFIASWSCFCQHYPEIGHLIKNGAIVAGCEVDYCSYNLR